jgi:subfamily B ATP-binding cassette protein MsbA
MQMFVAPFRRLGPYLRPHMATLALGGLCAVVAGAMEGAIAWLVKPAMDEIFIRRDLFMLKLIPLAVLGA